MTARRLLWALSFGHLVVDLSTGAIPAILPVVEHTLGVGVSALSAVVAVLNFTGSVIQPLFGYLGDRWRMRFLLLVGFVLAAVGMASVGFAPSYALLLALVVFTGVGTAAYHPEATRAAHYAGGTTPAAAMSVFSVGGNVGFALGPLVVAAAVSLLGPKGTVLFLLPGAIAFALFLRTRPGQVSDAGERRRTPQGRNNYLAAALLVATVMFRSALLFAIITFVPLYATHSLGMPARTAGLLDFAALGAGAVGTYFGGPLADRVGRPLFVWVSLLLSTPFVYFIAHTRGLLLVGSLILAGFFLVATFAVTVVLNQEALPRWIGIASGLSIGFSVGVGGILVLLLGQFAAAFGISRVLEVLVGLPLLASLAAFVLWLVFRRQGVAARPLAE
jgi:FSR family fosmidomycin resistance protein-like MFS transporter